MRTQEKGKISELQEKYDMLSRTKNMLVEMMNEPHVNEKDKWDFKVRINKIINQMTSLRFEIQQPFKN